MSERLDQLRQQLREDPSSRLFFQLGETLRKEGELEEAVQVLRTGLESYPRYVGAWVSLGRALYDLSSVAEAEHAFGKALELDPENPVASRMMGETAMGLGDWLRAIEALKLARIFSPKDGELEERIAFVEERLAEQGLLEGDPTARPAAVEKPTELIEVDEQVAAVTPPDPLPDPGASQDADVVALHGDDPFAAAVASGDSGDFKLGADVFGALEVEPGTVDPAAMEEATVADVEALEELPVVPPAQDPASDAVPLATMTLARLALDQGDRELARRTLEGLLDREPGHQEAARLLRELDGELEPEIDEEAAAPPSTLVEEKVAALQAWLNAVRLTSEVRRP